MFRNLLILSNVGESKTTKQQSLTIDAAASSQSAQFSAATCDGQLGRNNIFCHPTVHTSLAVASATIYVLSDQKSQKSTQKSTKKSEILKKVKFY